MRSKKVMTLRQFCRMLNIPMKPGKRNREDKKMVAEYQRNWLRSVGYR